MARLRLLLGAFGFCPRRARSLPLKEDLEDAEEGLHICNSPATEENQSSATAGSENAAEHGSMLAQLERAEDLHQRMQEPLSLLSGELDVLAKVWESQRLLRPLQRDPKAESKVKLQQQMQEIIANWTSDQKVVGQLEAILMQEGTENLLNQATRAAAQELLTVTTSVRQRLQQRAELRQLLEADAPQAADTASRLLQDGALQGRALLEYKLRRCLALPMTVECTMSFPDVGQEFVNNHSSFAGRTIPSHLSSFSADQ
ncbi:unnamed protein product [Effrenium voratum]|nr:unnamed protein product [Effrenium voratum]